MSKRTFEEIESMVEQCTTYNQLFDLWKEAHEAETEDSWVKTCPRKKENGKLLKPYEHINHQNFINDMIGQKYSCQKTKVIYILREANISKTDMVIESEFDKHWIKSCDKKALFYRDWMKKIYDIEVKKLYPEADEFNIDNVVYMNLNKRGGFSDCDHVNLNNYINVYSSYIRKEIEHLNPDIVICGGTYGHVKSIVIKTLNIINKKHPAARQRI